MGCGVWAKTLATKSQTTAIDRKKMVVLADPHVMAPELLVNKGTAWDTYLEGQRKLEDYSQRLFDDMIERIKQDIRPGLVLIPGDLTKDGEQVSHQYVTGKLDELRAMGIRTLVIPGNHDRGANSNAVYYDGANTTPAAVATKEWFAAQYENYGYGTSSERESTTLTYACEPLKGLVVIGIDSGTDGIVSGTTLNWVVKKATAARESGKKVIAMMHHPLIPHFTGVDNFVATSVVVNYETVRNALADAGIRVVYREVTLSADLSEISITTGHSTAIAAETAKERLRIAAENQIAKKIAKKGMFYTMISLAAANAFIYHAEGNEADNEEATNTLSSMMATAEVAKNVLGEAKAQKLLDMANSMLQDKSQYGTDREDQTNDLTLTIKLADLAGDVNGDDVVNVADIVEIIRRQGHQVKEQEIAAILSIIMKEP